MCGFAGIFDSYKVFNSEDLIKYSNDMASELIHRGPDDFGTWFNEYISISHRRLNIQDLTKAGSQPMKSKCQRYVIAFNGEIYNHLELRNEIKEKIILNSMVHLIQNHLLNTFHYGALKKL